MEFSLLAGRCAWLTANWSQLRGSYPIGSSGDPVPRSRVYSKDPVEYWALAVCEWGSGEQLSRPGGGPQGIASVLGATVSCELANCKL